MKCPFCGEPRFGESPAGVRYMCGTLGPDSNGDYSTGHTCDIHQWSQVLREKDAEIVQLKSELAQVKSDYTTYVNDVTTAEGVEIVRLRNELRITRHRLGVQRIAVLTDEEKEAWWQAWEAETERLAKGETDAT